MVVDVFPDAAEANILEAFEDETLEGVAPNTDCVEGVSVGVAKAVDAFAAAELKIEAADDVASNAEACEEANTVAAVDDVGDCESVDDFGAVEKIHN